MMDSLFTYFIQVNIYLIAIYLIHIGFLRSLRNYKFSRPFLLIGIASAFVLPFLQLSTIQVLDSGRFYSTQLSEVSIMALELPVHEISWMNIIVAIYASISLALLVRTLVQLIGLYSVKSSAVDLNGHYEISNSLAAFSFFNWIFIGSNYSKEEKEILLRHERVHVNKKHSFDIMLCQCLQILFWPNVIIFKFKALFQELHEYEADELSWEKNDNYLNLLIEQSFSHFPLITNQFKSSHLKLRIMRLKNQFTKKLTASKLGVTVLLCSAAVFLNQNVQAGSIANETEKIQVQGVEKAAEFPGGQVEMFNFIQGNLIFPKSMKEQGLSGKVFMEFIVQPDGSITDIKALKSPHEAFTEQAMKMMKKMPKWNAAEKDGEKVKMKLTLPINFEIPPPPPPPTPAK